METKSRLAEILLPLVEGLGLALVDLSFASHRGNTRIYLVLYKKDGINLEDLSRAQKNLRPRLELEFNRDKLSLEISSPGSTRTFKSSREYAVFKGCPVSLLIGDNWTTGVLVDSTEDLVFLSEKGKKRQYSVAEIRKAKLCSA